MIASEFIQFEKIFAGITFNHARKHVVSTVKQRDARHDSSTLNL